MDLIIGVFHPVHVEQIFHLARKVVGLGQPKRPTMLVKCHDLDFIAVLPADSFDPAASHRIENPLERRFAPMKETKVEAGIAASHPAPLLLNRSLVRRGGIFEVRGQMGFLVEVLVFAVELRTSLGPIDPKGFAIAHEDRLRSSTTQRHREFSIIGLFF